MDWDAEISRHTSRVAKIKQIDGSHKFDSLNAKHHVFVTGATGYLGAFLVAELLASPVENIWCLVRGSSNDHANKRIKDNLEKYGLATSEVDVRLKVVIGDLCVSRMGMSDAEWTDLAQNVHSVYHLAAVVNYALKYQEIEATTVGGTLEVIQFCATGRPKILHFVSTNAVFPLNPPQGTSSFCPEEVLPKEGRMCGNLADGYSQSKYIAELMVYEANRLLNLPCIIYRPGWIGPSKLTGASNPLDLLACIVAMCIFIKSAPVRGDGCEKWRLESWPVDVLAQVICGVANQPVSIQPEPRILHAINEHQVAAATVFQELQKAGHISNLVSQQEWREHISEKVKQLKDDKYFPKEAYAELEAFLPMLDEYAYWLVDLKTYGQENIKAMLSKLQIAYPEMNSDAFLKQANFLKQGKLFNILNEKCRGVSQNSL